MIFKVALGNRNINLTTIREQNDTNVVAEGTSIDLSYTLTQPELGSHMKCKFKLMAQSTPNPSDIILIIWREFDNFLWVDFFVNQVIPGWDTASSH